MENYVGHSIDIYRIPILIGTFSLLSLFIPNELTHYFVYQDDNVFSGDLWRLLTTNFLHLNLIHCLVNCIGMVGIWFIFPKVVPFLWQGIFFLAAAVSNTLGVLLFSASVHSFVGLSGALHGVFIAFCIADLDQSKWLCTVGLLGISTKITLENIGLTSNYIEGLISGPVAVDAHLWGAAGGTLVGLGYRLCAFLKRRHLLF